MLNWSIFHAIFIALVYYYYPEMLITPLATSSNKILTNYDFIIVGAGSAGCVLARRLSEVPQWKILLIEAGGDETIESKTPLFYPILPGTPLDWNYTTVKQKKACLAVGGICKYPRGHAMGGSSSINYMLFVRGNKLDYDDWANVDGADGWSYKDVLPYFKKLEDNRIKEFEGSSYRGKNGLLVAQYSNYKNNLTDPLIKAGEEIGLKNKDYNGEEQAGIISRAQLTVNNAMRWSLSSAYLNNIKRKNLHIIKNAKVIKVQIDARTKKTLGVTYRVDGISRTVLAAKEVVLSAGAINSPQLLMLSGVGPKEHLASLNIPIVADLPVGNNLQDHFFVTIPFGLKNYENLPVKPSIKNALELTRDKTGVYSTNGAPVTAFVNVAGDSLSVNPPDIQFKSLEGFSDFNETNLILFSTTLLKPKSVGNLKLKSNSPDEAPLIDPNYMDVQEDLDNTIAGMNLGMKLMNTSALKQFSPEIYAPAVKLCESKITIMKEFFICIVQYYSKTMFHPVGTCKMGKTNSPTTVVDSQLRVLKVKGLRVVDASIMPSVTRGNTNIPTVMIAEKGADIIKKNYGKTTLSVSTY